MELPQRDHLKLSKDLKAAALQQLQRILLHLTGRELSRGTVWGAARSNVASNLNWCYMLEGRGVRTDAQHEVVERLVVDVHERDLHGQSKVCQVCQVLPALSVRLLLRLLQQGKKERTPEEQSQRSLTSVQSQWMALDRGGGPD